jgi:hypothetical protein
MQRAPLGKLQKSPWSPTPQCAVLHQRSHLLLEKSGSAGPELYDANVFAVRLNGIHVLGDIEKSPAPDFHFHLLVSVFHFFAIRNQESIFAASSEQVPQELGMEQHI